MERIIWDEERIREEIAKLDLITGLEGRNLPIVFGNARHRLGSFYAGENMSFRFSNYWFGNPEWTVESALDVIRHEYAHYMNWVINRERGHGNSWKACCIRVGALPRRLYNSEIDNYYKELHLKEDELFDELSKYKNGHKVTHPKYGKGVIKSIEKSGSFMFAVVSFESVGEKRIDLKWLDEHSD
ncbi:MAG: SprT-like domain-containing protein [Faecalibacterium sp.]|nr:SprT-like domain-containing protein [Ruminococcus sp.]MCM1391240.1 SprT-like domain-containing protein [Ruminococcus sp.]MCM1484786.1 SprT-like domain-containing protein [Faecalibacterium sp.]